MHRALALVALLLAVPSPLEAQCGPADARALWDAIPEAERDGIELDGEGIAAPRVTSVELDLHPPAEAALAVDALLGDLHDAPARSLVWVLGCRAGRWTSLGRVRLDIDSSWDGTLDERPGVRVLRAETLPGVGHDLLRVEHVDVRGGVDPRFVRRRFMLLSLVDDRLTTALDVVVNEETTVGPARDDGPSVNRTLVYDRARPWIRVRTVETSPNRRRTLCRNRLRFDGSRFVPDHPRCGLR